MENVMSLKNQAFMPNVQLSKQDQEDLKELVQDDMKNIKIDVLKHILLERNIDFDDKINDYDELKKSISKSVEKGTLKERYILK